METQEWMTPKGKAIPKNNDNLEMGRYGLLWPKKKRLRVLGSRLLS